MEKCPYCGSTKLRKDGLKEAKQIWRCKKCNRRHTVGARLRRLPKKPTLISCVQCGKETTNPRFCSKSCSTTYSNLHYQERYRKTRKKRFCRHCGIEVEGRRTTCDDCNLTKVDWDNITIQQVSGRALYQIYAQIRQRARWRYRNSDRPKYRVNCGYDKHIEICHIRAIADFPEDTVVAEINDLKNLVALCPNCHWELDNGILTIQEIRSKNDAID